MTSITRRHQRSAGLLLNTPPPSGPLTISNIAYSAIGSSLTVSWNTSIPADSHTSLYYGPAKHCTFDMQLGNNTIDTSNGDQVQDFDAFDHTAPEVASMQASGTYCIAYFSGGSWEDWRSDAADFPAGVKGNNLDGWAGEKWLDVRQLATLYPIMAARADIAKAKGFNAIDWDNMDGYLQTTGFAITQADQHAYNLMLARIAHERGMACFLKNCVDDVAYYQPYYEGVVVEEAYRYNEAASYQAFATANKPVLEVEYRAGDASLANQNDANSRGYSLILQTLNLTGAYTASYVTNPPAAVALTDTQSPKVSASLATSHSATFTGLTPGQKYGFLLWSQAGSEIVYDSTPRTFTAA